MKNERDNSHLFQVLADLYEVVEMLTYRDFDKVRTFFDRDIDITEEAKKEIENARVLLDQWRSAQK